MPSGAKVGYDLLDGGEVFFCGDGGSSCESVDCIGDVRSCAEDIYEHSEKDGVLGVGLQWC